MLFISCQGLKMTLLAVHHDIGNGMHRHQLLHPHLTRVHHIRQSVAQCRHHSRAAVEVQAPIQAPKIHILLHRQALD